MPPPSPSPAISSAENRPRISFSFDAVPDSEMDRIALTSDRDFEFHLADPAPMLAADELFSGGKLVPLHSRCEVPHPQPSPEPFDPSPRAPTCSIRWRDLLALRAKLNRKPSSNPETKKPPISNPNPNPRSHSRSSIEPSLSLPLLRSSGEDREESPGMKARKRRPARRSRVVTVESPRMNSSGRVVFHGLERSSSGGNGGARIQVRVRPVINVPVGSLVGGGGGGGGGGGHLKGGSVLGFGIQSSRRKAMQSESLKL
ncbi:uncharacterized protein LOC120267699 [Dioscorea cayenensis subsp. rotundata]|uniref:Uncharacterized protein LOC120267699 n=1 Tax=Dioscorea cayennensis subsp. rotundata TaxID=55577 RepID=A0AB40BV17_DIOCR|nr:uncharacterized protein LOC120267699 [Dioscorea cayenensis subsp. rotundata]